MTLFLMNRRFFAASREELQLSLLRIEVLFFIAEIISSRQFFGLCRGNRQV
jgi:hypothetical protein